MRCPEIQMHLRSSRALMAWRHALGLASCPQRGSAFGADHSKALKELEIAQTLGCRTSPAASVLTTLHLPVSLASLAFYSLQYLGSINRNFFIALAGCWVCCSEIKCCIKDCCDTTNLSLIDWSVNIGWKRFTHSNINWLMNQLLSTSLWGQ